MIAIVGGLATAIVWAVSVLASARASRLIGSSSTVAGAMAIGLAIGLPVALVLAPRPDFGGDALLWVALSGFGNVAGLLLTYAAYRIGAVGIVSTIDSTEGAVAAVLSVLAGEVLVPGSGVVLAVIAVGVVLAASAGGSEEGVPISRDRATRAATLADHLGGVLRPRSVRFGPGREHPADRLGHPAAARRRCRIRGHPAARAPSLPDEPASPAVRRDHRRRRGPRLLVLRRSPPARASPSPRS